MAAARLCFWPVTVYPLVRSYKEAVRFCRESGETDEEISRYYLAMISHVTPGAYRWLTADVLRETLRRAVREALNEPRRPSPVVGGKTAVGDPESVSVVVVSMGDTEAPGGGMA